MFGPKRGARTMADRIGDADAIGMPSPARSASGNRFNQWTEKAAGALPGGARVMQDIERSKLEAIARGFEGEVQGAFGGIPSPAAGRRGGRRAVPGGPGAALRSRLQPDRPQLGRQPHRTTQFLDRVEQELAIGRRGNTLSPIVAQLRRISERPDRRVRGGGAPPPQRAPRPL